MKDRQSSAKSQFRATTVDIAGICSESDGPPEESDDEDTSEGQRGGGGRVCSVTALFTQDAGTTGAWDKAPVVWVGTSTGHVLLLDPSSLAPLVIARAHRGPVTCIGAAPRAPAGSQGTASAGYESGCTMIVTAGTGFAPQLPQREKDADHSLDGVLCFWERTLAQQTSALARYHAARHSLLENE